MAKIKSTLDIKLDLSKPVEELTQVISAVISTQPARKKEILEGLDLAVGNALADIKFEEGNQEQQNDDGSGKVS
ncbi:hypothetical protein [Paenibacillus medicaginis]|uniref:Phage protein n=1 Tax=Paenibacillus medicaginis TaxID=1470560 RepID=A0ABV5C154_9BACL